jgi:hypothetical protein
MAVRAQQPPADEAWQGAAEAHVVEVLVGLADQVLEGVPVLRRQVQRAPGREHARDLREQAALDLDLRLLDAACAAPLEDQVEHDQPKRPSG